MKRMLDNTVSRTNSWSDEDDIPPPPPPLSLDEAQLVAFSLDADGCLFNAKYHRSKQVLASNQSLLGHMTSKAQDTKHIVLLVGSNRQSHTLDQSNSIDNGTMSCFLAIEEITTYLSTTLDQHHVWLDRFLLADIHSDVAAGTAFSQAINPHHAGPHAETVFDRSKITLLYAQIHKLACEHRDKQITYNFYDDRQDILNSLILFLNHHLDLIPNHIIVNLYCYIGNEPLLLSRLSGTGLVNPYYDQHVKALANIGYQCPVKGEGFDVITALNNNERSRVGVLVIPPTTPSLLSMCDAHFFQSSNTLNAPTFTSTMRPFNVSPSDKVSGSMETEQLQPHSSPIQSTSLYFFIKYRNDENLVNLLDKPVFRTAMDSSTNYAQFRIKQQNKGLGLIKRTINVGNQEYTIEQHYVLIYEQHTVLTFNSDYCYTAQLKTSDNYSFSLSVYFNAHDQVINTCLFNKDTGESFDIEEQDNYWVTAVAAMYSAYALSPLRKKHERLLSKSVNIINEKIQDLLSLPHESSDDLNQCIFYSDCLLKQLSWLTHITQLHDYCNLIEQYKRLLDLKYMTLLSTEYDLIDENPGFCSDLKQSDDTGSALQTYIILIAEYESYYKHGIRINPKPSALAYFDATQDAMSALLACDNGSIINGKIINLLYSSLVESTKACLTQLGEALIQGDVPCANALSAFAPLLSDRILKIAIDSTETHLLEWLLMHAAFPINRVRITSDEEDMSLLEYALTQNKPACFELLLNHGASPLVLSTRGQPLAHVIINTIEGDFNNLLHAHIKARDCDPFYDQLSALIIDCKSEPSQRSTLTFFKREGADEIAQSSALSQGI